MNQTKKRKEKSFDQSPKDHPIDLFRFTYLLFPCSHFSFSPFLLFPQAPSQISANEAFLFPHKRFAVSRNSEWFLLKGQGGNKDQLKGRGRPTCMRVYSLKMDSLIQKQTAHIMEE